MTTRTDLPTGTVTFMFSDIEGSTRLVQRLGLGARDVFAAHADHIRDALRAHHGIEIRTEGDAFFCVFDAAENAVEAAVDAQRRLQGHPWPTDGEVRVRMGLHTGRGTLGGDDYFGLDVHRAARIAATGFGGQIVVSAATRAVAEQALPAGVGFRDLGFHRLKDLAEPERLYDLEIAGLLTQFPPLRTGGHSHRSLPEAPDSFIGRTRQVDEVSALIAEHPLVTLTGPGGVGKTRLSTAVADAVADTFDSAVFVPLAPIADPGEIAGVVLRELDAASTSEAPLDRLLAVIAEGRSLVVLDNFEHLLDGASIVSSMLRAAPGLRVLVTSRAPLRIAGEREYPVPPLLLADRMHLDEAADSEAVRLFVDRATAVRPDLVLDDEALAAIVDITSAVDGIPLAIELAAARVRVMPPTALRHRMTSMLDVLASASRDVDERQRTLRGAIAWSYDLLEPSQQGLLQDMSVFRGGATLDTIEAACGLDRSYWEWLDDLDALVGHSLVVRADDDEESRFMLLEVIREFAAEQLADAGKTAAVAERHLGWFLGLAEQAAPGLTSSDQRTWLSTLDHERYNLGAALDWAMASGDADRASRLVLALWRYWHMRRPVREGAELTEKVLAMENLEPRHRLRALEAAGGLAWWSGEMAVSADRYQESVDIARDLDDRPALANALYNAGMALGFHDRADTGERLLTEGLVLATEIGDDVTAANCHWGLASVHQFRREFDLAEHELTVALEIFRAHDDAFMVNWALRELGVVVLELGRIDEARDHFLAALRPFVAAGDLSGILLLLRDLARVAAMGGRSDVAFRLLGAVDEHEAASGLQLGQFELEGMGLTDPLAGGDARDPDALRAEGRAWSIDEAVAYALSNV